MAIKGAKTIAEYAIRKWLDSGELAMENFRFYMTGDRSGYIIDSCGDKLYLEYDPDSKMVIIVNS